MIRPLKCEHLGVRTDSAHDDCQLRRKGQFLEGNREETSLSTKSR